MDKHTKELENMFEKANKSFEQFIRPATVDGSAPAREDDQGRADAGCAVIWEKSIAKRRPCGVVNDAE